jgi:hypothetical protein
MTVSELHGPMAVHGKTKTERPSMSCQPVRETNVTRPYRNFEACARLAIFRHDCCANQFLVACFRPGFI